VTIERNRSEDSVVDPSLPKAEQEKQVEDEIEKDSNELYRPAGGSETGPGRTPPAG
jgi:hypothetical protein